MRNYIILNNQSSNDINGLIIQELAPISKPAQRTQVETIDGRDGDIVTPLGYAAYNKKIKIGLYGNFDINEIIAYFATKGTAIFSNEPDKYYNYQIVDQIDYERLVRYRVATVTMHVQPFKYSATEGTLTIDASDTVSGEGSEIALDNTAEAPFNTLRHKGNATQTTYTGKNLLPVPSTYANTGIKSYDVPLPAGTYTLSFEGATTTGSGHASYFRVYDDQNTDLATRTVDFSIPNKWTFTITSPATKFAIYSQNTYVGSSGVTTTFTDLQLEAGSSASDYEPYVGGTASPNPDYPQDIQVVTGEQTVKITGKNLVNQDQYGTNQTTYGLTANFASDKITLTGTSEANAWPSFTMYADGQLDKSRYWPVATAINTSRGAFNGEGTYRFTIYANGARGTVDSDFRYIIGYMDGTTENKYFPLTDLSQNIQITKPINFIAFGTQPNVTANCTIQVQLEKSASASPFDPYKEQSYKLNLGKNLLQITNLNTPVTSSGVTVSLNDDGTIKLNGTATSAAYINIARDYTNPAFTVRLIDSSSGAQTVDGLTLSASITNGRMTSIGHSTNNGWWAIQLYNGDTYDNAILKIQLEKGAATEWAPYFTPIELVGIGDYADEPVKVGDTWYIRRKIGKVVLDGTENWADYTSQLTAYYLAYETTRGKWGNAGTFASASSFMNDHFTSKAGTWANDAGNNLASTGYATYLKIDKTIASDAASLSTWLGTHNTTVYYTLATPTDEEVTNQALIDQFDEFYGQAHSYKGRTHLTATPQGDNAPAVLSVEVGEDNESTVTNSGNTTSRPILTIYGQGDIGVYINDVEVLDIELGDEGYITLDSVEMEAYKDTTANLKNRLVTGDYSKLALNAGDNKISFTGTVTKYEISKYSRWL